MTDDDENPGEVVPWEDLSRNERRQFMHMLQEAGLDDLDGPADARPFYGNRHRVEAELRRREAVQHDPTHDRHYGIINYDPEIELYGVGEFHPNVSGSGTPVFEAKTSNGSYVTFCLPPEDVGGEYLRVFHANSYEAGEFSLLMNVVLRHYAGEEVQPREVVFTNVVTEFMEGEDLDDKLHGFERETMEIPEGEPHAGEEIVELVGEWDPREGA